MTATENSGLTTIRVSLGERSYPIHIGAGFLARIPVMALEACRPSSVAILSHPMLARRYADALLRGFVASSIPVRLITVAAGERHKSLTTLSRIYKALAEAAIDRDGLLITLGGGVTGDLGGFAAATWLRGIDYMQVPTTLLAQVDASVGGKTGVDLPSGKNLVGAFYQPRAVFIDTDTLATLPKRQMRSGLAEVIKYGIICDKAFLACVHDSLPRLLSGDAAVLRQAITRSCEIKAQIVSGDETDRGRRAILNFGHTVGHALESVTGYARYTHGEAIAIGMVSAALIGEEIGFTPPDVRARIQSILSAAGLPTAFPDISAGVILDAARHDKKAVSGNLRFVLARSIASVEIVESVPDAAIEAALARQRRSSYG